SKPERGEKVWELMGRHGITIKKIGVTGGKSLKINSLIDLPVAKLRDIYEGAIPKYMERISRE
ncbi:MAG: hypothetical protein V3W18_02355, partial [candidate division Zixibacteria bacterium]